MPDSPHSDEARIRAEAARLRRAGYDAQTALEMAQERLDIQIEGQPGKTTT